MKAEQSSLTEYEQRNITFAEDVNDSIRALEKKHRLKRHKGLSFIRENNQGFRKYELAIENVDGKFRKSSGKYFYFGNKGCVTEKSNKEAYQKLCQLYAIMTILLRETKGRCLLHHPGECLDDVYETCLDENVDFDFLGNVDFSSDDDKHAAFIVFLIFFKLKYCSNQILDFSVEEAFERAIRLVQTSPHGFWHEESHRQYSNMQTEIALATGGWIPGASYENLNPVTAKESEHLFRFLASADEDETYSLERKYEGFETVPVSVSYRTSSLRCLIDFQLLMNLVLGHTKKDIQEKIIFSIFDFSVITDDSKKELPDILNAYDEILLDKEDSLSQIIENIEWIKDNFPNSGFEFEVLDSNRKEMTIKWLRETAPVFLALSNTIVKTASEYLQKNPNEIREAKNFIFYADYFLARMLLLPRDHEDRFHIRSSSIRSGFEFSSKIPHILKAFGSTETVEFVNQCSSFYREHIDEEVLTSKQMLAAARTMSEDPSCLFEWAYLLAKTE